MKKTLAIILSLALVICMMPAAAFAAETPAAPTITLSPSSDTYNGANQFPTVKLNGADITNTQYSTAWSKDGSPAYSPNGAGTYKLTVMTIAEPQTVVGEATYTIEKLDLSKVSIQMKDVFATPTTITLAENAEIYRYDGKELGASDKLCTWLNENVTCTVTQVGTTNQYKVEFTVASNENVTGSINPAYFNVVKSIANATLKAKSGSTVSGDKVTTSEYNSQVRKAEELFTLVYSDGSKDIQLNSSKDYYLTYPEIKNRGTYTVKVNGIGEYGSTKDVTVEVPARKLTGNDVRYDSVPEQTTDSYKTYEPVIKYSGATLEKDKDYYLRYPTAVSAGGQNYIDVDFTGNYYGGIQIPFSVVSDDYNISKLYVVVNGNKASENSVSQTTSNTYDGSAQYISADVKVYQDEKSYKDGKSPISTSAYSIVYKYTADGKEVSTTAPKDAKNYDVYVSGKGSYAGEVKIGTFRIAQYNMKNVTVNATVTSASTAPAVTVRGANGTYFEKDKDYTVSHSVNSYRNTMTITVRPTADGNLTGTSFTKTYSITARSFSYCTVSFSDGKDSAVYTGYTIPVNIVVKDGSTTLTKGTHYTVEYKNASGKTVSTIREAGTYTIVVTGDGGYSGTKTLTFTVYGTDISSYTVTLDNTSVNATGYSITLPKVTGVYRGTAKLSSSDYTVSYQDADGKTVTSIKAPGTYKVIVTGAGKYSGSTYATFRVVGLSQSITGVESSYKVYPNDTFVLSPKATEGRFTYSSSDPSVATVSSTGVVTAYKAGRAKITITTTGNTKYDQVSKSTVIKVYPKKAVITKKPWTNGKKAQLKVRWNKQENVTRYEIRYSRSKSFAKGTYLTKKVNAANNDYTTQSTTIKNLKSGYTYYVKVRAVKEVYNDYGKKITYYGKWSGWRSVKVK